MKENLKISVIIPVFNSEEYIEKCLNSILEQSYRNFEIIIINDGSKDNSKSILEKFEKEYPDKIKYIEQENMGVASTRNKAIEIAKGDYMAFIDNDDFIDKNYLQLLMQNSNNGYYDIVFCGYRRPNEKGKIIKELHVNNSDWCKFLIMAPWAKIYKSEYVKKNNIQFLNNNIGEDVYFNLQAFLLTEKIKFVDYIGYNWYFNSKSISNSKQKDFDKINVFNLLNNCIRVLDEKNIKEKNNQILELFFFRYIIWFLLFSCKGHKYNEIKEQHNRLFKWLKKYFPEYKRNKMIGLNKPKGESKNFQLFYFCFMILHKINLDKIFIYLYSKL